VSYNNQKTSKMKKYNEEYFSVIDRRTGRKIVDCAEYSDAMMMFGIDPHNRQITRNKFLMGQVVDVVMPKALPTTEIVQGGIGSSWESPISTSGNGPGKPLPQIKLPEGQQQPVKV
jgi:hypothetical protein